MEISSEELVLWWRETGVIELNNVLINCIGHGTGFVPLMNLVSEFTDLSEEQLIELIPYMVEDGVALRLCECKDGSKTVHLWVK